MPGEPLYTLIIIESSMANCPLCGAEMEEGFVTMTTNDVADLSWSKKPSILGLHSEKITGWSIIAKNMKGYRCQSCSLVAFEY